MVNGSPGLTDTLVAFGCEVLREDRQDTHRLVVGSVRDVLLDDGRPLIQTDRHYGSPMRLAPYGGKRDEGWDLKIGTLPGLGEIFLHIFLYEMDKPVWPPRRLPSISLHEGDQRQLVELLLDEVIDFAFLFDTTSDSRICAHSLCEFQPSIVLARKHPLGDPDETGDLTPERLAGFGMVLHDAPPNRDFALSYVDQAAPPDVCARTQSFDMAKRLVGCLMGFGIFATWTGSGGMNIVYNLVSGPVPGCTYRPLLVLCERGGWKRSAAAERFFVANTRLAKGEPV